jgi:spore maturation protein CgeB
VGDSLARAAEHLGLQYRLVEASRAFAAPRVCRVLAWHLGGHRPPRLRTVSREVVAACLEWQPRWLLSTGFAPLDVSSLAEIGRMGIARLNFLTDDPWNPLFRSEWFMTALGAYDYVFTPRHANVEDLRRHGCRQVSYLPFGFDPHLCFRQEPTQGDRADLAADVVFVGGADDDRLPFVAALLHAGMQVALYGDYWSRYPATRKHDRGHADPATVREATSAAKVALCLVRQANRDGHVMRSVEAGAIGACMLVQDTLEHRLLLGPDDDAVTYFDSIPRMVREARRLIESSDERRRLAAAVQRRIQSGHHTYADRLQSMLSTAAHEIRAPAVAR